MNINVLLFDNFETLDVFGPVEILGEVKEFVINYYSINGGLISNRHNVSIDTQPISNADRNGILFIPGGLGTRLLVNDTEFLDTVKNFANSSSYCLSVCTGSAILAKCGVLDGKKATSNKMALEWVKSQSDKVEWIDKARWVTDGKIYTSSGVSAGIDMTLGFLNDYLGTEYAKTISNNIEYLWNSNNDYDPFAN